MAIGDHLSVDYGLYTHHGIELGENLVIHYGRGLSDIKNAKVEIVSLETFANGKEVKFVDSPCSYSTEEITRRAKSRLGESRYDLLDNNCEHFANWCRSGVATSPQAGTTKTILRQSAAVASRPFVSKIVRNVAIRRSLTAPLILADVVQTGVELVAINRGNSKDRSEQLGARAGAVTSMGIGMATAGPIGAASGFGLWMAGQLFARAAVRSGQKIVHSRT